MRAHPDLPSVSVALATFNGIAYLPELIASIEGQSVPPLEIVVSDDGSDDGTQDLLSAWARRDARVRVVSDGEHRGFRDNFFHAARQCAGQWIALADQDDRWLPHKIESLLAHAESKDLVCSDAFLIDDQGKRRETTLWDFARTRVPGENAFHSLLFSNFVTGCTTLFRRDLLEDAWPVPAGEKYHDWWLALLAARRGGIAVAPRPLVEYRLHSGNDTGAVASSSPRRSMGQFFEHLVGQRHRSARFRYAEQQALRLESLSRWGGFHDRERAWVEEALSYYRGFMASRWHLRSGWIGWKYFRTIHGTPALWKQVASRLTELVG
jgi:glycosyltransferase involved in cell wall biosynthesis